MYVNGLMIYLEISLVSLGDISSCPQDLLPFKAPISSSTSSASKKMEFADLSPKNVLKFIFFN